MGSVKHIGKENGNIMKVKGFFLGNRFKLQECKRETWETKTE